MKYLTNDEIIEKLNEIKSNNSNSTKEIVKVEKEIQAISTLFSRTSKNHESFKEMIEQFTKEIDKNINKLNKKHNDKLMEFRNKIDKDINSLNENHEEKLSEIKENSIVKQSDLINQNTISNDRKEQFILELKRATQKNIKEIDKNIKELTLSTQTKVNAENQKYELLNKETKTNHSSIIKDINMVSKEEINYLNQELEKLLNEAKLQKEQRDENYVNIRSIYHNASTNFNKQIDKLKKNKNTLISKQEELHLENIVPYREETKDLETYFSAIKTSTLNEYEQVLENHFNTLEIIKKNYEKAKDKVNNETNQAISIINSNFTNLQEVAHDEKEQLSIDLKGELKNIKSNIEESSIKNKYQKLVKKIDNELIRQKRYRDQANFKKEQERYQKLKKAESQYINDRMKWRVEQQTKELEYKKSLDVVNTYYTIKTAEIKNNLSLQDKIFSNELRKIEQLHLLEIAPLQSQLNIAGLIQERDIVLLNNESSSASYLMEIEIEKNNFSKLMTKLTNEFQVDKENAKYELTTKKDSLINQLSVQKLNIKKDHKLKYFELTEQSLKISDQITQIDKGIQYKIDQLTLSSKKDFEQELLVLNTKYHNDLLDNEIHILNNNIKLETQKLEKNIKSKINELKTKLYQNQLNVLHQYSANIFDNFDIAYQKISSLITGFLNLYSLVVLPNHLKNYLLLINQIIKNVKGNLIDLINQFEQEVTQYINNVIDNISGLRKQTSSLKTEDKINRKTTILKSEIDEINNKLINISDQLYILESKFSKNERELQILEKQLQTFANDESIKENSKNLIQLIQTIKNDIKKLEVNQNSLNKKLTRKNTQYKRAILKDKQQFVNQKQGFFSKYHFGYHFLRKLNKINRDIKTLFNKNFTRIINQNLLLSKNSYLTDSNVGLYKNQISKFNNNYKQTIVKYYQNILNEFIDFYKILIDKKDKIALKEERYINQSISYFTKSSLKYQEMNDTLVNKHNEVVAKLEKDYEGYLEKDIKQLTLNSKKPLANLIRKQNSLKQQLNNYEQVLASELKLITDNLGYSLKNYESDYNNKISTLTNKYNQDISNQRQQSNKRIKNYNSTFESLLVKNSQIIKNYQTNYNLELQNLKKLQKDLKGKIKNLEILNSKQIQHNNNLQNELKIKHRLALKNHHNRFAKEIKEFEKQSLQEAKKELKDVEKSINFKLKTLKLN